MASCTICDKPALFRCGKCKAERYCSRECQKDHWPHHKTRCAQVGAAATDRPPPPGAAEGSAPRRANPQPPPAPPPTLNPQPPPRCLPASARSNPRTARLLGELPPGLQPEVAASPEETAEAVTPIAVSSMPVAIVGGNSSSGIGTHSSAPLETGAADGGACTSGGVAPATPRGGSNTASQTPQPPPRPPPAQPHASPPQGPRTPLPFQPAPPPGGPQPLSGRASMMLVRSQLRESAAAAAAAGGLVAEGRGSGLLRSGSNLGSGGSILDRVMPPTPAPPASDATVTVSPPTLPPPADAVSAPQIQQWPRAAGCAEAAGDSADAKRSRALSSSARAMAVAAARSAGSLSELPPELLLEVLKALPARSLAAAATVCRSWRRAAREPWLWVRQLCAAGYPLPAAAYNARHCAGAAAVVPPAPTRSAEDEVNASCGDGGGSLAGARAVPGVRGIRAVRAVRAAGGSSHEHFLGGLRAGFLDRLQQQGPGQQEPHGTNHLGQGQTSWGQGRGEVQQPPGQQPQPPAAASPAAVPDLLKGLYGRTARMESNWRSARYAESSLREHSSNVECVAFQRVEPWGSVLLSGAWDGSVRLFALGLAGGSPQQARCVRRYRGHTGWITCMAAGRHQVVTASTDRRVAAWRYYSESSDPWVALEHPQEVTLVRFCYAPPPPPTTHYPAHQVCGPHDQCRAGAAADCGGNGGSACLSGLEEEEEEELQDRYHEYGTQERAREVVALNMPYDPGWEDWVVTGCIDGVIRLWHLPTKQLLRTFAGHGDVVWGIAVLHGSSVMVSSSRDCTTRLWQLPHYTAMQVAIAPPALTGGGDGEVHGLAAAPAPAGGSQSLDAMATLCGHTSAILCMDVHRAPPGLLPLLSTAHASPASAVAPAHAGAAADVGSGGGDGGAGARRSAALGADPDMPAVLTNLLHTGLVEPPAAAGGAGHSPGGGDSATTGMSVSARAAAAAALPVWLVATGGADAVVRVWNLAAAQCHVTLRGHSVGVLSVQFGYLPRGAESHRDQLLLPPDLDVSAAAAAAPPSMALPPGQYGTGAGGGSGRPQRLPPSQRLVLVTGSVREVRVWDPVEGCGLVQLSDHSGPVTSVALVHGALVTLAMNDGLIVYKCNGLDGHDMAAAAGEDSNSNIGGGGDGTSMADLPPPEFAAVVVAAAPATSAGAGQSVSAASFVGRQRRRVAAPRCPLEPVICLQDGAHRSFSAALAVQLEGLAVGSGTGDITYLDLRPRASPLPHLTARRRLQL